MHAAAFREGMGLSTCEGAKHLMVVRPEPFVPKCAA